MPDPVTRVDPDDRNLGFEEANAELDRIAAENDARIEKLATMFGRAPAPGWSDVLYIKTLLEHLVGQWELPRARLRFQITCAELLDGSISEMSRQMLAGEDLAMSPSEIIHSLPNREQRRHGG